MPAPTTPMTRTTSTTSPIRSLDGLRGLAILVVVWCHLDWMLALVRGHVDPQTTPAHYMLLPPTQGAQTTPLYWLRILAHNGTAGVPLFFVLSGFLLFLPYARTLVSPAGHPWPSVRTFYLRRVLRILPGYLPVLLVVLALTMLAHATHAAVSADQPAPADALDVVLGVSLLYDLRASAFGAVAGQVWDGALWSLTIEWQFYLLLPLFAWLLARLGRLVAVVVALFALMAAGLLVRLTVVLGAQLPGGAITHNLLYGANGKYLEVFVLGMLAALVYVWSIERGRVDVVWQRRLGRMLAPISLVGLAGCVVWATFVAGRYDKPLPAAGGFGPGSYAVVGDWAEGVCMALLLVSVLYLPESLGRLFSLRPLAWLGLISYSLYLWHMPLLRVLLDGLRLPWPVALAIVCGASAVLYRVVERPFLRHRRMGHERPVLAQDQVVVRPSIPTASVH